MGSFYLDEPEDKIPDGPTWTTEQGKVLSINFMERSHLMATMHRMILVFREQKSQAKKRICYSKDGIMFQMYRPEEEMKPSDVIRMKKVSQMFPVFKHMVRTAILKGYIDKQSDIMNWEKRK